VTDANGCTATAAKSLTISTNPTATITGQNSICEGAATEFTALGGVSYAWSNGATTATITVSTAGVYRVTVTDANGCKSSAERFLTILQNPVVSITGVDKICEGTDAVWTLNTNASQILWSNNQTGNSIIVAQAGLYGVTVTDQNNCSSTASRILQNVAQPVAGSDLDLGCVRLPGGMLQLNGQVAGSWSLSANNPGSVNISNLNVLNPVISGFTVPGIYQFILQNDICSDTVSVRLDAKPNAGPSPAIVSCYLDGLVQLNATGTGIWTKASENPGNVKILNPNSPNTLVTDFEKEGLYRLIWSNGTCSDTVQFLVGAACACPVSANLISNPNPDKFCEKAQNVTIRGLDANPAGGKYTWQYSQDGVQFIMAPGNAESRDYTTGTLLQGTHYFRRIYTMNTAPYCSDTSNIAIIHVEQLLTAPFNVWVSHDPICLGDTLEVRVSGRPGAVFSWKTNAKEAGLVASQTGTATMIPTSAGTFRVTVTQKTEVCEESAPYTFEIKVNPKPQLRISRDTTICEQDGGIFLYAGKHATVRWSDGTISDNMYVRSRGNYGVTVTDENGCENSTEITIKNFCCKLYHPNIVHLDSRQNNFFQITETSCVIESKLRIFDRWGNLVYISDKGLEPWDGTFKGVPVEQGVYTFLFTYKALDEDNRPFDDKLAGDITVIR
jgi:gliding motility-associated-like protein